MGFTMKSHTHILLYFAHTFLLNNVVPHSSRYIEFVSHLLQVQPKSTLYRNLSI